MPIKKKWVSWEEFQNVLQGGAWTPSPHTHEKGDITDWLHATSHEKGGDDLIDTLGDLTVDKLTLGSYYLDSNALVANNLVFNSSKWNGQTIYLTGVTGGQILKYNSVTFRWENYDVPPPPAHASSHEKGGSDLIDLLGDLTVDQLIIGSYYLDTDGLVGNNKVFNSSKWDGQAIYLTDVQPGDILKYNSVTFRWENYDFVADAHASTHLVGGSDPLSVGVPVNIGTSNAAGTATNFVRRDHVHAHPSGLGVNLHHAQSHTLASHSTKAHSELTGIGAGDHHPQLHAATHKSGQSDEIDLVFNSQKWNGQTIYLTGLTGGQILKYNSTEFRWENADFVPDAHASTHHVGGSDLVNHDSLTGFVAAEHLSLPNTIVNVLSDHNKSVHDSLGLDHGALSGKGDDDHSQYILASGTRAFTGVVSGVTPTSAAHLATKAYVDGQVAGVNEFVELTDTPSNYTGSAGKFVKVNATPDALVFANIAWADVSKTGSNLTDLVTRTHSSLQSIGVDDHHDQLHASDHLVAAGDALSVGVPVNIGTSNAAGTATNFARRDHVHAHPSALGTDLHHPKLHASTHESGQSDQIDLVFNSQKWDGQTIDLTGVTNGQILRYNSTSFNWENEDIPAPSAHASEHEVGGGDLVSHDDLTDFVAAEHLSLPNTIANVLSNHNLTIHNALGITTLGTVGTGVWQATAIGWTYVSKTGSNLTDLATRQHAGLTDITPNQHHDESHTLASHSTKAHSELSDAPANAHHDELHAASHEPSAGDQIDLVFNSQKWNGQTIYLTDIANGQILRYDSGDLRWENADLTDHNHTRSQITDFFGSPFWASIPDKPSTFPPSAHASAHEKGGGDLIDTLGDLTVDSLIIGSYYLDSDGLVGNNKVFNSSKWDGQAIYLTDVQPGDILKYNSVTFRWENYDFVADAHASTHLVGGSDPLSVGVPVNIGTSNAAGTATNFVRRDHVHAHPSGLGVNLHHAQSHTLASHSTKAHSELSDAPANAHHDQAHTFVSHTDTPANYTGAGGKVVAVKAGEDGLEFITGPPPGLHASTHEPSASDQIDLVFNSQKWNGQTIYLASLLNGQMLVYDSTDFRWENRDHNKASHDALALDHGALGGKGDDDHTQYYNATRHTKAVHDALVINAGLVDGYHAAEASTASTVAARNSSGDINARLFKSEYDSTNATCNYIMTQIDTVSNNYIRPSTKAQLIASLNLMTKAGGIFTGHVYARDHGTAATDMLTNICYGTGSPPSASSTTIGTLFVKYTA